MRRTLVGLGGLVASALVLGLSTAGSSVAASGGPPDPSVPDLHSVLSPSSPIKHVVIIYQENHTFDDVLGPVCVADHRKMPCDGYVGPVTFADGVTANGVVQDDIVPVVDHNPPSQVAGLHNRWDRINGCEVPPYYCVSTVDPANMANLTRFANKYAVSDRTFAAGQASSFGAHVTLAGGSLVGFQGYNPVLSRTGATPRDGWGCYSRLDVLWGRTKPYSYEPACVPDKKGRGPYRESKVPYSPTIMERVEQAHLTWHMYEGQDDTGEPNMTNWSVCTYYNWCWKHRWSLEYDSPRQHFLEDATAGTLPNLSILIPTGNVSQHNLTSMTGGDNYLGDMVGAVMNGPDWDSTAIFITYDDCGCFYDHVAPPTKRMGMRNPLVIISPWVRRGYTDSQDAIQPYSILAFTEHVFGLDPLTDEVTESYDYADSFDFSQQPLSGVPTTFKPIPKVERALLAKLLPLVDNDPT